MAKATTCYAVAKDPEGKNASYSILETSRKVAAAIAKPAVEAVKHESPETLAKLVIAALAPQIVRSSLRFAGRHPVLAIAGLAGFSIWLGRSHEAAPARAA
jgi:hypothetical protein